MPRRALAFGFAMLLLAGGVSAFGQDGGPSSPPATAGSDAGVDREPRNLDGCVLRARLQGVVNAGTADYLNSAVDEVEDGPCQALLLVIDTPGGALSATRRIVRSLLDASVPIVTYVAPGGARAGSAGVFITMAGHVAAMAPGSNMGAAHPVVGMGQDPEEAGGKQMAKKVENDTAAFARSIAERRGRNVQWAEKAVRESVSATAREALEQDVIDRVVSSQRALLRAIDGQTVTLPEKGPVRLRTGEASVRDYDMTIQQRAMTLLGNPTLTYILFMLGVLGIMMELYNPGMIVPGAIGAVAFVLAAIGINALPVNIGALVLLAVAVAFFAAEIYVTSFGLLTLGGLGAMLIGAALLVDESDPDFFADASVRVSWGAIVPIAVVLSAAVAGLAWQAAALRHRRSPTGREGMIGVRGRTEGPVGPDGGRVRIHGESWQATAPQALAADTPVRVAALNGLQLRVEPLDEHDPSGESERD